MAMFDVVVLSLILNLCAWSVCVWVANAPGMKLLEVYLGYWHVCDLLLN